MICKDIVMEKADLRTTHQKADVFVDMQMVHFAPEGINSKHSGDFW